MIFEYSDGLLLQAIKFSEQGDEGATLKDIIQAADYIDHSIMTYLEFTTGANKLKQIGFVEEQSKRLRTTKTFKDWWTKKFEGKKRIEILKALEGVKKYLDKTYATNDSQMTAKTEFTKADLDKAIMEYQKLTSDILKEMATKKKNK